MTLQHRDLDVDGRLHRTIARESEAVAKHVVPFARSASFSIQEVVDELPGQALEGAYLTRASRLHWVLGAASACLFVVAVPLLFPWKGALDRALFAVGAFTATFGIAFLFLVQIALMRYYGDADDPRTDVFHSMLGFTLGVGVAEEVSKALPILITIMMGKTLDWRRACLFGVASGVGFGVFEGIHYASTMYNGVYFRDVYVVRFVSCVALHAVWSGSAGILLAERQATVRGARLGDLRWVLPAVLAGPIILHGFYDTLLKFGYAGLALLAALGSLAWFATEVRRMEATCVATA
jgi:RsiW-degrading membrane proteinase PrsW (M82 family)